ncbi:MAG: hypothetical protein F6K32_14560 [Desertifilum sp. SIO1I2]|nr:hypothetical protein [Desertifilum sp. SIO1I2]
MRGRGYVLAVYVLVAFTEGDLKCDRHFHYCFRLLPLLCLSGTALESE